jgi:UDP-GlcNAc:undecaprenyl-phosphate GlcNAc-1-phosphate transferase
MLLWLVLIIAFCLTFTVTPLVIRLSQRFGFVDFPTRNHPAILHKKPIPRAGGVAALFGFIISLLFVGFIGGSFVFNKAVIAIFFSSVIIVLVGLLDDLYDLSPYLRLIFNIFVVTIVVGAGIGITSFTNPFGGFFRLDSIIYSFSLPETFGLLSGEHSIILLADIVAFIWIVWVMNALNWSSGVDGQLSGIAALTLTVLGIVSVQLISTDPSQLNTAFISLAAAGAFLGFLPWSFYPQKIMPGYGGSSLAGFLIAVIAILSGAKLATALLVLLVPLIDSIWAILRRILQGKSPVWGDSFHLHHQLLKLGWSIPQICLLYYSLTVLLGLLAINSDSQEKFFAILILGVIIFSILFTGFVFLRKISITKNVKKN